MSTIIRRALVLVALAGSLHAGQIHFVDADATGAGDGSSWADAHPSLQDALAVAVAGDEIRVAGGTYTPEGEGATDTYKWVMAGGVSLRGSFAGVGAPDPDAQDLSVLQTVLSGDHAGNDVPFDQTLNRFDNSRTLLEVGAGSAPTLVEGFVMRGAFAHAIGPLGGGCILAQGTALSVRDCRLEDSKSRRFGAGIYVIDSVLDVQDVAFDRLQVGTQSEDGFAGGAALAAAGSQVAVSDCLFTGNRGNDLHDFNSVLGGAMYFSADGGPLAGTALIQRCRFEDNHSDDFGGAAYLFNVGPGSVEVLDCDFIDNDSGPGSGLFSLAGGGALSMVGSVDVARSRFLGNRVVTPGVAAGTAVWCEFAGGTLSQCEFSGNGWLNDTGPALYILFGDGVRVDGCSFTGNRSQGDSVTTKAAGLHVGSNSTGCVISNSILWGNESGGAAGQAAQVTDPTGTTSFIHTLIEGWTGSLPGSGNMGGDPLFADADGPDDLAGTKDDDLRPAPGSPAIDAGSSAAVLADASDLDCDGDTAEAVPLDLSGLVRAVDDPATPDTGLGAPVVDLGAHEFGAGLPTDQWTDLGGGSAGAFGLPVFAGAGTFCEGQLIAVDLAGAPPGSLALLLESHVSTPVPAFGGVVHAVPIFAQFLLVLGASGGFHAEIPLDVSVPSGFEFFTQVLVQDDTVPGGVILSNALRAVTP